MRRNWKISVAIICITAALVTGCGGNQNSSINSANDSTVVTESEESTTDTTEPTISTSSTVVVDKEFTANDLEVGYEESTATKVKLNDKNIEVSGDGASAKEGVLTIHDKGTYVITGTLKEGQIIVDAEDSDKVQIVLNGVTITCSFNAPVYVKNADKVFLTLHSNTENTLIDGTEYTQIDDNKVDGVIFSTADLTINGEGTLTINGNYKHGIASKDDLVIAGGTFHITAVKDALNGKDCVKIKEGIFYLTVKDGNGIQSKNDDDTTKGYVYIGGGVINIENSQEGIEGTAIVIDDGIINIIAQDDGLNASSGEATTEADSNSANITETPTDMDTSTDVNTDITVSSDATSSATNDTSAGKFGRGGFGAGGGEMENNANCYIAINGGTVTLDASGDGLDSNGSIYLSGGTTYVNGPTADNNAGMDYNGTAEITGGTIVVIGSAGMAQGFSDTSTQYSILNNFTSSITEGTEVKLTDKDGNTVVSYIPKKQYQSILVSSPDLIKDETYTLSCGDQSTELTLSSIVTSNGQQGGGFGGRGGKMNRDGQPPQGRIEQPSDDTTTS